MSKQGELNFYIRQLRRRLRLGAWLRGVAILAAAALATTFFLVLILNAFAFPIHSLTGARAILLLVLALATILGLGLPLMRLNRRRSIAKAEAARPEFQQRLVTFSEREALGNEPFIELLAADTLQIAQDASPAALVPDKKLLALAGAGVACAGVLLWMIAAGPGYLGYGASLIWTGPKSAPLYDIQVAPGDAAVRRNGDQLVTAKVIGLQVDKAQLYARYQGAVSKLGQSARWEPVAMLPQPGGSGFQFLFAGLPENVEYYVQAGPLTSRHFKIRVVDLPSVKQIQVTYHYPKWTGMQQVSEKHGGDLRAIEGTNAELEVLMDRPLRDGLLVLDSGQQVHLTGGQGNMYEGSIPMQKDGSYHVAALDHGQQVRLSEDYFIATDKANPPEIAIVRPGGDYRASPIEEVTIGVKASDQFGLKDVNLHYSVNGGPDKSVDLLKQPGAKSLDGSTTLNLEDFKLIPGDLVSLYATAKDGHSEAHSDITFIQANPFERDFSQSQQSGGGGGGGGQGQNGQADISRRQKELIAETWKHQNDKSLSRKEAAGAGKFLSEAQTKLRDQALALAGRMQSRDLSAANEAFGSFAQDMQAAAGQMTPSADKLKQQAWRDAIPSEQKALEYLLRAEATFRQIEVAFGRGGGGGGGGSAGRDLASLFDLELDTQKNQYETAQTGSPQDQRAQAVDDALKKLDALAHRQEELAQQHNSTQTFQERWQQEMLRREAEQLQRQMEQMAQNNSQGQQGGQGQQSSSGSSGQQSSNGQSGSQSGSSQSQSSQARSGSQQAASRAGGNASDPRITQALNRLRQAEEEMKRGAGQQQSPGAAQRAADQLRQATDLLGGAQHQEATSKLDSLSREADRLNKEEHAQANEIRSLSNQQGASAQAQSAESIEQRVQRLADQRQQLADNLSALQTGLRDTARGLAPNQPATSSKLRDALSAMDQADLSNRVQRTADWLRRGIDPNTNGTETAIGSGLQHLSDQVRQAEQSMGTGNQPSQGRAQGQEMAALDHVERLRSQIESMAATGRNGQGRQPGQQGQNGQRGQNGQQGQGSQQGQNGQSGQGSQSGQGGQGGQLSRGGQQGQDGQYAQGNQNGQAGNAGQPGAGFGQQLGGRSGDVGNRNPRGGGGQGTVVFNVNTGDNRFDRAGARPVSPDDSAIPASSERAYRDGLTELNQLRDLTQSDPEALKQVQDLVRQMQGLDPKRFPGNPALVEQLHTQVLSDVDKLELQLRRDTGDDASGQVRTSRPSPIPPGYQDAVAEYFRRLGKGQ